MADAYRWLQSKKQTFQQAGLEMQAALRSEAKHFFLQGENETWSYCREIKATFLCAILSCYFQSGSLNKRDFARVIWCEAYYQLPTKLSLPFSYTESHPNPPKFFNATFFCLLSNSFSFGLCISRLYFFFLNVGTTKIHIFPLHSHYRCYF